MHPEIAAFPSKHFYNSRLVSAVTAEQRPRPPGLRWPSARCPVAFVCLAGGEKRKALDAIGAGTQPEGAAALPLELPLEPEEYEAAMDAADSAADGSQNGKGGERATSYANPEEASALAAVAAALMANGVAASDIGVLTPYAAQALVLQQALARADRNSARAGRSPASGSGGCADIEVSRAADMRLGYPASVHG